MRSMPSRSVLLALCLLPLLSTSCARPLTPRPSARTERPRLPTLDAELTRTERLKPLTAAPSGDLVTIDRAILQELYDRFAEAIAAVLRGNVRADGVRQERECTAAILGTGVPEPGCPPIARD